VKILTDRASALRDPDLNVYDVVITDLDVHPGDVAETPDVAGAKCLPNFPEDFEAENIKAFKLCAANFRREGFTEEELRDLVATVLDYKIRFVDREEAVQGLHEKIEFELPSAMSLMHIVLDYLLKRVAKLRVIDPESSNLFVALDEAFVNAVKHGNKYDSNKVVRIECEISQKEARFTVEDEGEGFDVNAIPDPLDPENLFKTSGRGVLFIYNIMDEVAYNERGNRLTMVKKAAEDKNMA
jgi:serine/threonine-protein kinase RsbW